MIIQKEIRNLIKEIADKEGKSFEEVREIVYSQFKFVREQIESAEKGNRDSYKNIQLRFFGTFYFSENMFNFFKKKFEEDGE